MAMQGVRRYVKMSSVSVVILGFVMALAAQNSGQELPAQDQLVPAPPITINDVFAEIGRRAPQFGGMFVDAEKDTLYVYMVPGGTSGMTELDQAFIGVLGPNRPRQSRLEVLQGQYSFVQLKEWHDRMSPRILAMRGAVLTAIDQAINRLRVGLETLAVEDDVAAELAQLGIPREAVNIEKIPPRDSLILQEVPNTVAATNTLQSYNRPLVGGLRIEFTRPGGFFITCTLGFYAERSDGKTDVPGFVTNSHCTRVAGGVEDTIYHQPAVLKKDGCTQGNGRCRVGTETVDPCYWDPSRFPPTYPPDCKPIVPPLWCPAGRFCRLSDSAFAKLESSANVTVKKGYIARPTDKNDIDWDPPDTYFKIVGENSFVMVGSPVSRVGQITGWTPGKIKAVCVNENSSSKSETLICQNEGDFESDHGDSGSAFFECLGDKGPIACSDAKPDKDKAISVNLVGLLWGGTSTITIFSPIGKVGDATATGVQNAAHELGPLKKKCAEGGC